MITTETKQVCQIRILFPVDSDDDAIEYKKKISEIVSSIQDARIQFSLNTMPPDNMAGRPAIG